MSHVAILNWVASTDTVAGYNVYRGAAPGSEGATPLNTGLVTGLTYSDTTVVAGQKYDYVVTAVSSAGVESVHSNEVGVIVPVAAPTNLTATVQ